MRVGTAAGEPRGTRRVSAIVLAAGLSTRLGRPKPTITVAGEPLLAHLLGWLSRSRVSEVLVVLGHEAELVRSAVDLHAVHTVVNPDYRDGMSGSIQAGLRAADPDAAAFLIVLGDQPFVDPATVDRLIDEWLQGGGGILVPTFEGRRGNPVLVDRVVARQAHALQGDVGFRALFGQPGVLVRNVPVEDPGVLFDVDTPEDVHALQERLDRGVPRGDALKEVVTVRPHGRQAP